MRFTTLAAILFLTALYSAGTGCVSVSPIYYDDDKAVAKHTVERFHELFNDEKYDEIYDLFSDKGKQVAETKENFIGHLRNLRNSSGRITSSTPETIDVKPQSSTRLVHMFYSSQFEKKIIREEFDCIVDGKRGLIEFYGQPDEKK
jgi:hypothetical protein